MLVAIVIHITELRGRVNGKRQRASLTGVVGNGKEGMRDGRRERKRGRKATQGFQRPNLMKTDSVYFLFSGAFY